MCAELANICGFGRQVSGLLGSLLLWLLCRPSALGMLGMYLLRPGVLWL